jgi:hypothetical protein
MLPDPHLDEQTLRNEWYVIRSEVNYEVRHGVLPHAFSDYLGPIDSGIGAHGTDTADSRALYSAWRGFSSAISASSFPDLFSAHIPIFTEVATNLRTQHGPHPFPTAAIEQLVISLSALAAGGADLSELLPPVLIAVGLITHQFQRLPHDDKARDWSVLGAKLNKLTDALQLCERYCALLSLVKAATIHLFTRLALAA